MFGRAACSQADAGAKDENLSRRCLQERTAVTEATSIQFVPPGPRSEAEIFRPREPNVRDDARPEARSAFWRRCRSRGY
jgi:hypothetical protein